MKRLALAALALAALAAGGSVAEAQQRPRSATPAPTPAEPAETPLIYEPELMKLAEALGVIAYMSQLCAEPDAEDWRRRAQQVIDAESGTQARKERLAGAYNRGYFGHQAMHRGCSDAARLVIERRRAEARRITQDISTRFGG